MEKLDFFNPVKKNNLKTGTVSEKRSKKQNCFNSPRGLPSFWNYCWQIFKPWGSFFISYYHCTFINRISWWEVETVRKSFRNYIIKQSEALHTIPPKDAAWFIDGMAFISCLKPKKTYKEWISALIRFIFPDSSITMKLFAFINDTYKADSMKNITRQERGTSSTKFNIPRFEQNMLQSDTWQELLNENECKD